MKRLREAEAAEGAPRDDADADPTVGAAAKPAAGAAAADAGDAGAEGPAGGGDAAPAAPPVEMRACPFLDTVSRASLDFDFEPRCSVTLSPLHVYACLVCGRYYQGRGPSTPAFAHALEAGHHVYMHLQNGRVFCLPDGYEVLDRSLDDVRQVLQPRFSPADVAALDAAPRWSRALDGCDFLPGCVGLNNLRATDYAAASLQALLRVRPLRDALLLRPARAEGPGADSDLVVRLCGLARKVWNPRAFKGHVSPHELMQAVVAASGKRFRIEAQARGGRGRGECSRPPRPSLSLSR